VFQFYATIDVDSLASYIPADIPILLPASSWARYGLRPPVIPEQVKKTAADSGGYVASKIWGEYRYSLNQYVSWLLNWHPGPPEWAAMIDYCCEPELAVVTRERQDRTTANALEAWSQYKGVPFVWTPTIQGLNPLDYQRHAQELAPLIVDMQQFYNQRGQGDSFRVGVGTLCRRADSMTILAIVTAIRSVLPDIPLHLWGIKLASLRAMNVAQMGIKSTDSAAWADKLYNGRTMREEAASAGLSIRRYAITVKLPAYMAKVKEAAARPATLPNTERETAIALVSNAIQARGWTPRIRSRRAREYVYAVKRSGQKLEEQYLGPLDCSADAIARAGALPNLQLSLW
jgi:hypothetical protein